jgi:hypothetical protein
MATLDQRRCSSRDAYAAWQKGAVANANGRRRRDLPRDLDVLGDTELQAIVLTVSVRLRRPGAVSAGSATLPRQRNAREGTRRSG